MYVCMYVVALSLVAAAPPDRSVRFRCETSKMAFKVGCGQRVAGVELKLGHFNHSNLRCDNLKAAYHGQ